MVNTTEFNSVIIVATGGILKPLAAIVEVYITHHIDYLGNPSTAYWPWVSATTASAT